MGTRLGFSSEKEETAAGAETKRTTYAGSYDFGVAKVGLVYVKRDVDNAVTNAMGIHLAAPLAKNLTLGITSTKYDSDADDAESQQVMTIGAQYDFSKRTSLFASYQTLKTDGTDTIASTRGLGVESVLNETTKGYGITVVHKF
jgi:predicted porin